VTGDWATEATENSLQLRCPDCGTVVQQR
jgi:predicted RNA-binding Zn-ribbon protein involved in translation (DUF1610 family)